MYGFCNFAREPPIKNALINRVRAIGDAWGDYFSADVSMWVMPPIHAAICYGSVDIVRELLFVGGSGQLVHRRGVTVQFSGFCFAAMYGSPEVFAEVIEHADMGYLYSDYFPEPSCLFVMLVAHDDDFWLKPQRYCIDDECSTKWRVSNLCTLLDLEPFHEETRRLLQAVESPDNKLQMVPSVVQGLMQHVRWGRHCKQAWIHAVVRCGFRN